MAGATRTGAAGNTTPYTTLLGPHKPEPAVPAGVEPHADVKTYRASNVWHPSDDGGACEPLNPPKSILYCTVNPAIAGTDGRVSAMLHVLDGAVRTGDAGKITTLTVLLVAHAPGP